MMGVIGASGFIGTNFMGNFSAAVPITREHLESSQVIELDTLVIAAPGARKYEINQNPQGDRENIVRLLEQISRSLRTRRITLFSTIDVYKVPIDVDEESEIRTDLTYGGNRAIFEIEIQKLAPVVNIRRLPGLFGPGLKKNLIFDLINNRQDQLSNYSSESIFQYIHIDEAIKLGVEESLEQYEILNVVTPPIKVSDIVGLPMSSEPKSVRYNVMTKYHPKNYFLEKVM
jgi:nucleoside-diphosphate-sugar epimerase